MLSEPSLGQYSNICESRKRREERKIEMEAGLLIRGTSFFSTMAKLPEISKTRCHVIPDLAVVQSDGC